MAQKSSKIRDLQKNIVGIYGTPVSKPMPKKETLQVPTTPNPVSNSQEDKDKKKLNHMTLKRVRSPGRPPSENLTRRINLNETEPPQPPAKKQNTNDDNSTQNPVVQISEVVLPPVQPQQVFVFQPVTEENNTRSIDSNSNPEETFKVPTPAVSTSNHVEEAPRSFKAPTPRLTAKQVSFSTFPIQAEQQQEALMKTSNVSSVAPTDTLSPPTPKKSILKKSPSTSSLQETNSNITATPPVTTQVTTVTPRYNPKGYYLKAGIGLVLTLIFYLLMSIKSEVMGII